MRGVVSERTEDWYAQDKDGNVWYFGEATAELNRKGKVLNTDGSWEAGVDGAAPGIFMTANPTVGQSFAQEHFPGQAEDWFVVMFTGTRVTVPAGTYKGAIVTGEWTPLEPGVVSEKTARRRTSRASGRSWSATSQAVTRPCGWSRSPAPDRRLARAGVDSGA